MLPPKKRLLDQVRDRLRLKNYAYRTEKSYLSSALFPDMEKYPFPSYLASTESNNRYSILPAKFVPMVSTP